MLKSYEWTLTLNGRTVLAFEENRLGNEKERNVYKLDYRSENPRQRDRRLRKRRQ